LGGLLLANIRPWVCDSFQVLSVAGFESYTCPVKSRQGTKVLECLQILHCKGFKVLGLVLLQSKTFEKVRKSAEMLPSLRPSFGHGCHGQL